MKPYGRHDIHSAEREDGGDRVDERAGDEPDGVGAPESEDADRDVADGDEAARDVADGDDAEDDVAERELTGGEVADGEALRRASRWRRLLVTRHARSALDRRHRHAEELPPTGVRFEARELASEVGEGLVIGEPGRRRLDHERRAND